MTAPDQPTAAEQFAAWFHQLMTQETANPFDQQAPDTTTESETTE